MKQSITFSNFTDAFRKMGREDQFSYDALKVLFDWFEQYEEDCDTEIELDVIAICCEYGEEDWGDIADNYSIDVSECDDEGEQVVLDYLNDHTMVCGQTSSTIVYAQF